jgi:hypothetical protein
MDGGGRRRRMEGDGGGGGSLIQRNSAMNQVDTGRDRAKARGRT